MFCVRTDCGCIGEACIQTLQEYVGVAEVGKAFIDGIRCKLPLICEVWFVESGVDKCFRCETVGKRLRDRRTRIESKIGNGYAYRRVMK